MSLRLAPVNLIASRMSTTSVMRRCFEPGSARSVRFGPVFEPCLQPVAGNGDVLGRLPSRPAGPVT